MKYQFPKGHKFSVGRPKGSKTNPGLNTLKGILSECFNENRPWIKECIKQMLNDYRKHLNEINGRIAVLDEKEKTYASDLRALCGVRTALLEDFKWLLQLKASFEPRDPVVVVNSTQEEHTHITTVNLNNMKEPELIDTLLGRVNGHISQS